MARLPASAPSRRSVTPTRCSVNSSQFPAEFRLLRRWILTSSGGIDGTASQSLVNSALEDEGPLVGAGAAHVLVPALVGRREETDQEREQDLQRAEAGLIPQQAAEAGAPQGGQ